MAGVEPLRALHYDLGKVGGLADVVAPPYDVIDEAQRAELASRSPYNVVEIDLPRDPGGGDPYEHAARLLAEWKREGALVDAPEPAIWALTQDYTAPDGRRTTRRGFLARVRLAEYGDGVRPHERTQPGPKEDRLRLTRATRHNLSPIFSLHPGDAWAHIEPALGTDPWDEVTDGDGTTHRVWRVGDPAIREAISAELGDAELLIADGHHRYETALAYAREIGGEGPHDYVLMALVSLEDPGLTVFATHRLLKELSSEQQERIRDVAGRNFELEEVAEDTIVPGPDEPPLSFGYMDAHHLKPWRLRPRPEAAKAMNESAPGRSEAYRRLDAAALEELFLKNAVGLTAEDIAAKKQLGYTPSAEEAIAKLKGGEYDAAFFLRPTPVEQVREVAAAGETMPPKSTYFFPKLPTGIVFNPLT
ncbi:MAG TPA: DUF1015 domain-containing protein [Solirubrobacterales bacterium]|jgi:uncharacterized protein (DUF1015 family)|nr:DUF1015 domain-containing protein [Solirubrobacterales bacterium]